MLNFVQCPCCGARLHRTPLQLKKSKSGLYFCDYYCKAVHYGCNNYIISVPWDSPVFSATRAAYNLPRPGKEYLTGITLCKVAIKHRKVLGDYMVIANAKVNGNPQLAGKTPANMDAIRQCFIGRVTLNNIESLPEMNEAFNDDWKRVELRYWNENDVTCEID